MNKPMFAVGIGVIVLGIIIFVLVQAATTRNDTDTPADSESDTEMTEETTETTEDDQDELAMVELTYTNDGFNPDTLTVPAGSVLAVRNDSSGMLEFSSDPHPAHTDNPELNMAPIAPGHSAALTVTSQGSWGFHNHARATHTGTLVVE